MGFYGNITNSARTQFQFDRTFPNRKAMEDGMQSDGVYVGRYVLIEYDTDITNVYKNQAYRKPADIDSTQSIYLYTSTNYEKANIIRYKESIETEETDDGIILYGSTAGTVCFVSTDTDDIYYICQGYETDDTDSTIKYAKFVKLDTDSNYVVNYNIDREYAIEKSYSDIGRGWDSTVWQKVYTNGVEKYVMIAELNTVVPTFDISADAPSLSPVTPHFDANSTNMYYKLHWQPQWGLRIKSSNKDLTGPKINSDGSIVSGSAITLRNKGVTYPSDSTVAWTKWEYDPNEDKSTEYYFTVSGNTGTWTPVVPLANDVQVPAAIYYNKDGFSSSTIKYSDGFNPLTSTYSSSAITDEILLEPSGLSGHLYNQHDKSYDTAPEVDTQELSIMLPSLGNSVAQMWDLIYGDSVINEGTTRNQDIAWEDAMNTIKKEGLRLIETSSDGYNYNKAAVNTLAGCINSVHDLMGMIIKSCSPDTSDLPNSYIYYDSNEKKFYRLRINYQYTANSNDSYIKVELNPWTVDLYYYKNGYTYVPAPESDPIDERTYYDLTGCFSTDPVTLTNLYEAGRYYYKLGDNYIREDSGTAIDNRQYYTISSTYGNKYFYSPNKFWYNTDTSGADIGEDNDACDDSEELVAGRQYYIKTLEQRQSGSQIIEQTVWTEVNVIAFVENMYYKKVVSNNTETYELITTCPDCSTTACGCYTLTANQNVGFYQPSKYYYLDGDIWTLDTASYSVNSETNVIELPDGRVYYTLLSTPLPIANKFYKTNTYYTKSGDTYTISSSDYDSDVDYYKLETKYVINDNDYFPRGSVWNPEAEVPSTVQLGYRTEIKEKEELEGFADSFTTIHGLILKIKSVLETGNLLTRDNQTVQGAINCLNDIVYSITQLVPGCIMIVDKYGRMHGATHTSAQTYNWTNIGQNTSGTETAAQEDQWIYCDPDYSAEQPQLVLKHQSHSVTDTTTSSDKNEDGASGTGLNQDHGDTLSLYTPIVDTTGHIVGKNTETVTLPFGFKILKSENSSVDGSKWSQSDGATSSTNESVADIVADNTQDTLSFKAGNKWIRLQSDASTDTLTFAHETHDVNPTSGDESLEKADAGATFSVPTYAFDIAGHYSGCNTITYTMPNSYGKFVGDSGESEADATYDSFSILSGDDWLTTAVTADTITITHNDPISTTNVAKDNAEPEFGSTFTIEDWYFDDKGHKNELKTHTVKIPQGSLTDATKNGADVITQLSFTPSTGALATTRANIGDLKLTGYEVASTASAIGSNDSLNSAIGKVEYKLNILNGNSSVDGSVDKKIDTAITSLINGAPGTLDTLKEIADWIANDETATDALIDRVATNEGNITDLTSRVSTIEGWSAKDITGTQITNWDNVVTLVGNTEVSEQIVNVTGTPDSGQTLQDEIDALETLVGDTAVNSQIIAITGTPDTNETLQSEIDNLESLPIITTFDTQEQVEKIVTNETTFTYSYDNVDTDKTISELFDYIATLEARIKTLEDSINE